MQELFAAIERGDLAQIKRLVRDDPKSLNQAVDACDQSPLMAAIRDVDRSFEIIEFLVETGADVNYATSEGYTPLHVNIDLNGPSGSGEMPYRVARLLKSRGADTERRNHYGWTPLMRAALEGTEDEFQALLDIGAKADVAYTTGSMPVFTRGKSLAAIVLPWPNKMRRLLAAGFRPDRSLIDEGNRALREAGEKYSPFCEKVQESLRLVEKALRG